MNSSELRKMLADIDEADRLLDHAERRLDEAGGGRALALVRQARGRLGKYIPNQPSTTQDAG